MNKLTLSLSAFAAVAGVCLGGVAASTSLDVPSPAPTPRAIPALDDPPFATCRRNYPEELNVFPLAFSGTIVKEQDAANTEASPEARMTPRVVTFKVDTVYQGNLGDTVVMRTWDYQASTRNASHVGERFLVAAEQSRDIQLCGYTRPHSDQDAAYWAHVYNKS